jgi:hypothetical protein
MNATTTNTNEPARKVSQFWAWAYLSGSVKASRGPVWGRDAYEAAGEARRLHGAGVYQIRETRQDGRIVLQRA